MARILYVITRSIMGGAQTHVLELAKSFKDMHQVSVAVGARGGHSVGLLGGSGRGLRVGWRVDQERVAD